MKILKGRGCSAATEAGIVPSTQTVLRQCRLTGAGPQIPHLSESGHFSSRSETTAVVYSLIQQRLIENLPLWILLELQGWTRCQGPMPLESMCLPTRTWSGEHTYRQSSFSDYWTKNRTQPLTLFCSFSQHISPLQGILILVCFYPSVFPRKNVSSLSVICPWHSLLSLQHHPYHAVGAQPNICQVHLFNELTDLLEEFCSRNLQGMSWRIPEGLLTNYKPEITTKTALGA